MYTHVVMFKLKDRKDIDFVADTLRSMNGRIPELKSLEVGINDIESERNYDLVIITRFASQDDYLLYAEHEYHVNEVLAKIKDLRESSAVVDFAGQDQ